MVLASEGLMLTTLELARKIAEAVMNVHQGPSWSTITDEHADAIFRVLRENDSWFCRMPTGEDGEQALEDIRPYEQQPLF